VNLLYIVSFFSYFLSLFIYKKQKKNTFRFALFLS
ncbi:unnamed protein product, partial [Brassica napus]